MVSCQLGPGRGGGGITYERGGDARRLALGCKFRILVSLGVFWGKCCSPYVAVKVSFRVSQEKIKDKCLVCFK